MAQAQQPEPQLESPLVPRLKAASGYEDEIDLRELVGKLWARRILVLLCTLVVASAALAYAFYATPIFRAEAVLSIREEGQRGGLAAVAAGQLGGLADLAGLSIPGSKDRAVAVATLRSRALIEQFISDRKLVDVLFDPAESSGAVGEDRVKTVWDAHRKFTKDIFSATEDKKSGLIVVAVEWKDPQQATEWVTDIVARTNDRLRQVAIDESEKNLAYLDAQARKTNVVEIQQSLYRLAETEIKKLMLARGSGEYVFKTIDPARVPERKIKPKRAVIVLGGTLLGGFLGVFLALALPDRRKPAL